MFNKIADPSFGSSAAFSSRIGSADILSAGEFDGLLSERTLSGYEKLKEWANTLGMKSYVNEIDASKINGRHRKDFPQALYFRDNVTLDELNRRAPTYPEPKDSLDPRVIAAGQAACRKNAVAILTNPEAVKKMNTDEEFFAAVMAKLEEKVTPSVQAGKTLPRVRSDGDFVIETTGRSIIVEIDENGNVGGEIISTGICYSGGVLVSGSDSGIENISRYLTDGTFEIDGACWEVVPFTPAERPAAENVLPELSELSSIPEIFNALAGLLVRFWRKRELIVGRYSAEETEPFGTSERNDTVVYGAASELSDLRRRIKQR